MDEQNIKKHVNVTIIDVTQRGTDTWSDSYKIFREFTGTEYQEATYIFTKIENGTPYVIRDIDAEEAKSFAEKLENAGATVKIEVIEVDSQYDKKAPDVPSDRELSKMDRDGLIDLFDSVYQAADALQNASDIRDGIINEIDGISDKAHAISVELSLRQWLLIAGGVVLGYIIGSFIANLVGGILAIATGIFLYWQFSQRNQTSPEPTKQAAAEAFFSDNTKQLFVELNKIESEMGKLIKNGWVEWGESIVGEDAFNPDALRNMINLLKTRRADSLKEALNLYDELKSRERIEEMQRAIQEATEISAIESAKQTAVMEEIEKNTKEAAQAAKSSEQANWGTYVNTRRMYRKMNRRR